MVVKHFHPSSATIFLAASPCRTSISIFSQCLGCARLSAPFCRQISALLRLRSYVGALMSALSVGALLLGALLTGCPLGQWLTITTQTRISMVHHMLSIAADNFLRLQRVRWKQLRRSFC